MSRTQPVLIGGLVMGVLSSLPFISAVNACCCLWLIAGGMVAAYLLQQNQTAPITAADGAIVGLLAGLTGAVINLVLSIPIDILMAPVERALFQRVADLSGAMPPALRDLLDQAAVQREAGGFMFVALQRFLFFFLMLVLGAMFSTLGGVLGAAIFKKPPQPPGVIDIPRPPEGFGGA